MFYPSLQQSPQSYSITPKGDNRPLIMSKSAEDYGMDQNSDDSTDDESDPRKPIPSWAEGRRDLVSSSKTQEQKWIEHFVYLL